MDHHRPHPVPRQLLLASASPRRLEILRSIGIVPSVAPAHIDETPEPAETPSDTVVRLALAKARRAAIERVPMSDGAIVLGADTEVVLGRELLGKPADAADAERMLARLSGRAHEVITALALLEPASGREETGVSRTRVTFAPLSRDEIARYVATGEPLDKAGSYGIQGGAAMFVKSVEGSYTNVVGLPVELLEEMLGRLGIGLGDLGEPADGR